MPGYHQPVEEFANAWPALTADATDVLVVCLAEASERRRKSPTYDQFLEATHLGDRWQEFPIKDYSAPNASLEFLVLLDQMIDILSKPEGLVVIHCAAGVGRTGTVAASLLVRMGLTNGKALAAVREAGSGPETDAQKQVVRAIRPRSALLAPIQADSEPEVLRRLLDQFDAQEIREQLHGFPTYCHDALVPGDEALPRLMRCIQSSDLDFRGRSLNEIVRCVVGH